MATATRRESIPNQTTKTTTLNRYDQPIQQKTGRGVEQEVSVRLMHKSEAFSGVEVLEFTIPMCQCNRPAFGTRFSYRTHSNINPIGLRASPYS